MLIYAIDDEPNMLYLLHEAIAEAAPGAEIRDFTLGADAVARIEQGGERPDAVFSDIRMPGLSGLELASRLKRAAPKMKHARNQLPQRSPAVVSSSPSSGSVAATVILRR